MKIKIGRHVPYYTSNIHGMVYSRFHEYPNTKISQVVESFDDLLNMAFFAPLNWVLGKTAFRCRHVNIKIDEYDVWDMDNTLAMIIHPMLIKLKENIQGWPITIDEKDAPDIDSDEDKWNFILDEMIWTFGMIVDDNDDVYVKETIQDENAFMGQRIIFDFDLIGEHEKRISNGLYLFGKYYRDLWV